MSKQQSPNPETGQGSIARARPVLLVRPMDRCRGPDSGRVHNAGAFGCRAIGSRFGPSEVGKDLGTCHPDGSTGAGRGRVDLYEGRRLRGDVQVEKPQGRMLRFRPDGVDSDP